MNDTTFPRTVRLTRADDFARVKKTGRRTRSGPLLISWAAGPKPRLGVIIPRHVGGAVKRNRIRRVVREFFRTNRGMFPPGDCVVIPQMGATEATNDELREHLVRGIKRLTGRSGAA